jgi:hypothetical protein
MGSEKGYFGAPENSLLRRGAAAVVAGILALSLSACKTTNATDSNSGSEISTSVNDGDTSAGVSNGNETAPGVNHNNDNGQWEKVEATADTNTDPRNGLAVVDGVLTVCIGDDLYKYNKPEDDTLNSFKITTDENLVSVNDPTCIGSHPDNSSGWGTYIENDSNEKGVMSCVKYKDGEAEVYAETNKTDTTVKRNAIRGGCYFTRKNNSQ